MIIQPLHLARRFFSSLFPRPLTSDEQVWASSFLNDREAALFSKMSPSDRRHSVVVARRAETSLEADGRSAETTRIVMAAALMHDVGKTEARLGTYGRVVATLSLALGGHDMAQIWRQRSGFTRKVGLYGTYGEIGAEMLALAGSHEWVASWSKEHHLPPDEWTIPHNVGELLAEADD